MKSLYLGNLTILFILSLVFLNCKSTTDPVSSTITSFDLTVSDANIRLGEQSQVRVSFVKEGTPDTSLIWFSDNSDIATVNDSGLIVTQSRGMVVITAASRLDITKSANITIQVTEVSRVTAVNIAGQVLDDSLELTAGVTEQLVVSVGVVGNVSTDVSWHSTDNDIADVNIRGMLTAKKKGEVTIIATARADATKSDSFLLIVKPLPSVTSVEIRQNGPYMITVSDALLLDVDVEIEGGRVDTSVVWMSSDTSLATVSANGLITAVGVVATGETRVNIIVSSVVDTSKADTVSVLIILPPIVTDVILEPTGSSVVVGETQILNLTVLILNQANSSVVYSISDSSIVSITMSADSIIVTGLSQGRATITARSVFDPTKLAEATVNVIEPKVIVVTLLSTTTSINLEENISLTVMVEVEGGASQNVRWSSSNMSIATVIDGVVTGVALGSATITATSVFDSDKTAIVIITVTN